jgi:CRISPR/Cas system CSM-associated protein Csm3 (group 7 of RAMP superfamily)
MQEYRLKIKLESDTTFGRGDGVAGLVDAEVQHDAYGLPYLGGRALKGLLGAECADIVYALKEARPDQAGRWQAAEQRLFGKSGGTLAGEAILRVGTARLPADLRAAVAHDIRQGRLTRAEALETLTALRRQTAVDAETGAPKKDTLRTMRVILRGTVFEAELSFAETPAANDLALLAACVKAFRRAGTGRNRGRGRLTTDLYDADGLPVTDAHFDEFRKAVGL